MMTIFFFVCWLSTTSYRKGETEYNFSPKGGRTHALKSMTDMTDISQILLLLYAFFSEIDAKTNILGMVQTCPTYSHSIMLPWFYSTCKSIFLKPPLKRRPRLSSTSIWCLFVMDGTRKSYGPSMKGSTLLPNLL